MKQIQPDRVTIDWKPPADTGGLDLNHYTIEKCDPNKKVWMKIADVDPETTSYCVEKLQPETDYLFRIIARNDVGSSEPLESETVKLTSTLGETLWKTQTFLNDIPYFPNFFSPILISSLVLLPVLITPIFYYFFIVYV